MSAREEAEDKRLESQGWKETGPSPFYRAHMYAQGKRVWRYSDEYTGTRSFWAVLAENRRNTGPDTAPVLEVLVGEGAGKWEEVQDLDKLITSVMIWTSPTSNETE